MQRHFSNRGEALSEITAARVLARRRKRAKSVPTKQDVRRNMPAEWFVRPAEATHRPVMKPPHREGDDSPLL